jgi:hypothetical protein
MGEVVVTLRVARRLENMERKFTVACRARCVHVDFLAVIHVFDG